MEKGILSRIEDPQRGLPRRPPFWPLEDGIVDVATAEHHGDAPGSRVALERTGDGMEISWEIRLHFDGKFRP